jgi:hypothetical protein
MTSLAHWLVSAGVSIVAHVAAFQAISPLIATASQPNQASIEFSGEEAFAVNIAKEAVEASPSVASVEANSTAVVTDTEAEVAATEPTVEAQAEVSPVLTQVEDPETTAGVEAELPLPTEKSEPATDVNGQAESPVTPTATDQTAEADVVAVDTTVVSSNESVGVSGDIVASPDDSTVAILAKEEMADGANLPPSDSGTVTSPVSESVSADVPGNTLAAPAADSGGVTDAAVESGLVAAPAAESTSGHAAEATNSAVAGTIGVETSITSADAAAPVPEETQTAMVAPVPPTPPSAPKDYRPTIIAYFKSYQSGRCTLIRPKKIGAEGAVVEGIGVDPQQFETLNTDFRATVGADLSLRSSIIAPLQCAAIDLVKALALPEGPKLGIGLAEPDIKDGAILVATIENFDDRWLSILIVDDDGMVSDVSGMIDQSDGKLTLRAPVTLKGNGSGRNQLLIAVSSDKPLRMLEFKNQPKAEDVLPLVIGEKAFTKTRTDIAVAAFRVQRIAP